MISTTLRAVMICHYSVMDKKSRIKIIRLFWYGQQDLNSAQTASHARQSPRRHFRRYSVCLPISSAFRVRETPNGGAGDGLFVRTKREGGVCLPLFCE